MKHLLKPTKLLPLLILAFLYVVLTVRVLFVAVPQMLREADTVVNLLALVAIVAWACITYCIAFNLRKLKPTQKKGTRRP